MKSKSLLLLIWGVIISTSAYSKGWDEQYCSLLQPTTKQNVSQAQLISLYQDMMKACNSDKPEKLFSLYTQNITKNMEKHFQLSKAAQMYCSGFLKVDRKLSSEPNNGSHSIVVDGNRTNCGISVSHWFIHKNKEMLLRLKLAYENGQLKINDH